MCARGSSDHENILVATKIKSLHSQEMKLLKNAFIDGSLFEFRVSKNICINSLGTCEFSDHENILFITKMKVLRGIQTNL